MSDGSVRYAAELAPEQIESIRPIFKMFDKRQDGRIPVPDIPTVLRATGLNPTEAQLKDLTAEVLEESKPP